jgi:riboflavin kinase
MRLGANQRYVPISTSELAERLGQSQQAASLHLLELEQEGFIDRRRSGLRHSIKLTLQGLELVSSFYSELKSILEKVHEYVFRGRVFEGLGEGGYYISLHGYKKQFMKLLGFEPFPGTLNLKLESPLYVDQKRQLRYIEGIRIEGFENGSRTYGGAKCFKAQVNETYPVAVLVIDRTHYDDSVLEVISPLNLRKELGLKNGDEVNVRVFLGP